MKFNIRLIIIFSYFFIFSNCSYAALFIDDTFTTDKGHFSLEFSVDYYKDIEKEFDPDAEEYIRTVSKEWVITNSIAYGLTDNWEIEVVVPYKFLDSTSTGQTDGPCDVIINTKYRFWEEKRFLPSFALYLDLKTDTGNDDKSLGTGKKNYSVNNIFTKTLGNNIFDLNLGYTFMEGDTDDILFYSFDVARDLTDKLNICSEIYGETTFRGNFDKNIFVWALSLGYQLNKMICLESGVGVGISKASPDLQISTTVTFSF